MSDIWSALQFLTTYFLPYHLDVK